VCDVLPLNRAIRLYSSKYKDDYSQSSSSYLSWSVWLRQVVAADGEALRDSVRAEDVLAGGVADAAESSLIPNQQMNREWDA